VNDRLLRLRSPRPAAVPAPAASAEKRAVEFAWRVHSAQSAWASHADVKASILLVLEGGALYAVLSGLGADGFLTRRGGHGESVLVAVGIGLLLMAIAAAAIAVVPRLGRAPRAGQRAHIIYFGHLRRWAAAELRDQLTGLAEDGELDMLSHQLIRMSQRNWVKHRWVQVSLALALAGILVIAFPALIPTGNS
jgi:hypothetical protein